MKPIKLSFVSGLLSWDVNDCLVDLEKELAIITEQALEGEEARFGERLIQYASENLVTEILIHPVVSTLAQCMRNLLSSFTRHRHIIHAGYTFAANGSWALQDGTFSFSDFSEAFQELDVQRVIHAYENGISLDLHCSPEGDWTRLPKEPYTKACKVRINPSDVLNSGSPIIVDFMNYIAPFLVPTSLENLLESSDVVGNIRFSRPTLYVFPGGQGDAALFGINGFNMLLDGGYSRKACFWDFVRHLDRLDAVLMTRLNNSNVSGISSVLKRKKQDAVYPQIGHFFCNIQERRAILSPDGDKDKDPLLINLLDEGQEIISNLRHLNLTPQVCYRDSEPINLYHKVGHGTLDMYVLSPAKNSKEVKEFLQKWNQSDQKLFANTKSNRDFSIPIQNLISIAALLVWQPANPKDTITRILYPGSSPQSRIFEGLDRLKNLEFIKHAVCTEKSLTPLSISKKTAKDTIMEKVNQKEKKDNKIENNMITSVNGDSKEKERTVKKSDSTESDRSSKAKKQEEPKIIENGDKLRAKPRTAKLRSDSQQRKKTIDKKTPTPTPKKTVENEEIKKPLKSSPDITPAKSAKDANNRKVIESKTKRDTGAAAKPYSPPEPKTKVERKPISRRPVAKKAPISPAKKLVSGLQKPDSISRKGKLDKEGTTDSSTVSTPSADQETVLKKDLSKLTPEEIQQLKAQELADLKEEQEAVKEIEAVFRKGEFQPVRDESLRKVRDVSIDEKLDKEEYLIIEKEEIEPTESSVEKDTKENETFKLARDSEESEKQRNLSSEDIGKRLSDTGTHVVQDVKINELDAGKVVSSEERLDMSTEKKTTDKEQEDNIRDVMESHPEDKVSANMKSGDTTTAPTLPEDERIPFDETKEDGHAVVEKYVKEETKEKEIPLIQLPQKSLVDTVSKLPGVVGIRLDKQQHIRDIVKTPDEVADLPVHEEVDYEYTHELKAETPKSNEMIEKRFETEENGVAYSKEQEKEVEQEKEKDDFIQGRIDDDKTSTMHEELRNLTKTVLDNESILQTDILKQSEKITEELEHDEKGDGVKKEEPVEHKPSQEMKLSTAGNTKDTESKIEVSNNVMKASLATDTPKPVEKDYSENARHEMIVDCDSKKLIKDEKFSEVREPILETTGEDTSAEGNSEPGKQKILDIQPEQPEETKTGMEARETAEKDEGKQILDLKQSQTPQKPEETKSTMEHEEKEGTSTARDEKEIEETEKDEGKEILDLKEDSSNKPEGIKTIMEHEEKGEKPSGRDERESETAEKDEGKQILDLKQDSPKNPERTKSIMEHEEKEEKPIGIEEKESGATEKDEGKEILDLKEDSSNKPEGTKIIMEHEENVETPIGGNEKESDVTEDDKGKEILDLKEDLSNKPEGTKIIMKHEEKEGKPIGRDGKESEATERDEGNEILDLKENSSNKPEGTKIIVEHEENVEKPIGGNEKESDVTEDDKGKEIFDLVEDLSNKPEGTKIIMEHEEKEGKPIGRDEKGSEATEKDEGKEIPDLKEDSSNKPEGTEIIMEHEEKEEKSIGIDEKGSEATEKDEGKEILELKEDLSNKPEGTKVIMKHEEKGEEPFGRDERKSGTAEKEEGKQILDLKQDSPKKPEGTKSLMEYEEKEEVPIGRNEKESDATEADEGMEKLELKEDSSKKPEGTKAVMEHKEKEEKPIGRNEKESDATEEDEGKEILDLKEDSSKKPEGTKAVMENEEKEEEPIRRNEKESDATEDDEGKDILDLKEYSSNKPERIKHKMVHEEKEEKTIGRDEKMKSHEFLDECEDVLSVERVKSDFDTKEAEVLKSSKEDKDSLEEIEKKLQHLKQSQIEIEADQTSVTSTEEVAVSNEEILEREGKGTDQGLGEAHGEKTDNVCLAERKIIEMHDVVVKESEVAPEVKEGTFEDEKIEKQLARTEIEESIEKSTDETPNHSISREIVEEGYHISASPELIEKIELGRKSPKEREGDVIKIVASVAEVLKSAASLEEFKGKVPIISIPISSQRKPHTTELRETHITTVDSPIVEYKVIKTDIPTIPEEALTSFLEEERKLAAVHDPEEDKRNILLRESQELMIATSEMISHIKSVKSEEDLKDALPTQQLKETSSENEKKQDEELEDEEGGVIHRMLVTASSEDGGEETEICPPGTIIYSRSSESSGRSSPDQKMSQKSSIIDTISDTLSTVRQVEEVQDSDEVAQESQVQMIISPEKQPLKGASSKESETLETAEEVTSQLISSGKSSPDKDASIKSLASGKSTPDMSDLEKFRETSSTEDLKKIDDIDRSLQTEETGYIKEKDLPIMYSVSKEMPERSVSEKIEETIEDGVKAITTKSLFSYEKVQDNEGSNIPQGKTTTENNLKVSEKEEDKEKEIRSLDKAGVENTVEDIRKTITRTIDSVIEFIQPTIDHTSSTENLEKHDGVAKVNPDGKYFSEDLKPISVEDYSKEKVLEKSAEKSEDITVAPEKSERSEPMSMTPETKLENDQFIEETIKVDSDKSQQKKDEGKFENSIPEEPAKSIKRTVEDFPEKIKENKVVGHISTREKENIIDVEVELLQHIPEKKTVEEKQKSERTKCSVESVDSRDISDKTTTHSATINLAGKTCTEEISVKIKSEMAEKIYYESEKAIEKSGETPLFQKPVRDIVDKEDNELIQEGMPKKELGYIGEKIKDITEHNRENLAQRVSGEPSENMDYTEMMKEGLKDPVSSLFEEIKDISRKMLDDAKHIFEETTYSISALPDKMTAKTKNINSETKVEQTEQDQTEKTEEDGKGLKHITCDQSEKKETDSFMTEVKEVDYSKVQEDADRKTLDDEESKSTNLTQEYTEKGQLPVSLEDNSRIAMRFYDETENSQSTIPPKGENVFDSSGTPVKVDVQKYPEESSQICVSEKGTDEKETLKDVKFLDDYTKPPSLSSKLTPELDECFEEKSIVKNVSSSIEKIIKPIASEIDSKIEVSNEKLREKCEKDLTEAGGVIVGKSTEEDGELFENSPETPSTVIIESHIGKDKIIADSTKKTTSDSKAHEDLEEVKSKKLIFEQSTEKLEGVVASKISCWENIQQEEKLDDDIKYKMDPDGVSERTTEEIVESVLTERKKSASEVSQEKSIDGCLKLSEEIVKQEETMISESAKDIETTFESVKDMTKAVVFETCPNPEKKDECEIEQQILKDEVITQTTEISHIKPVNDLGNKLGTIQNLLQHKESVSNDSAVTLRKTSASGKAEQEEENTKSSRDLEESLETVQNSTESITLDKYESTEKKRSFDNETVRNLKQSHHEKKISEDEKTEKDVEVITKHLLKKETIAKIGDQPTPIVFDESIATEARTIIGESTTMVEEILHHKSEAEKEIDDAKGDSNSISKGGERFDSDGTIKILEASNKLNAGKKDIKKEDIKIHEETFETIIPAINNSMKSGSLILQMDKSDADKIIDKKKEPVESESKIHQVKLLESSEKSDVRRLGIDEIIDEKNDYVEPHEEACEEKLEETSRITSAADDSMGSEKEVIHEGTYKTKYVVDAFLEKSDVEKLYIDGEEKPVELHEETSRITSAVDDSMESRKEVMQVKSVEYTEDPNSNAGKVGKHIDVKENSEKLPKETSKTTPGVESNKESARVPGASFKNVTLLEEEEYLNNILGGAVVKSDMSKSVHLGRETISDVGQDIATLKQKHHEESETTKQFIRDSEITKMMEHDENISDKVDQKYSDAEQKTEIVTISSKSAVSDDISRSKLDSEESTLQHMKQDAKKHHYEDAQPDTTACTTELSLEQSTKDLENTLEAVEGLSQSVVFEKCESTKTTTSVGDVSTKDIQHVKTLAVEEYDEAILEQSARDLEDTFETVKNMSQSLIFRKCDSTETKVSTEDLSLKALKEYTTEKPLDEHEVIQKLTKEQEATHKQLASDLKDISQSITAKDQEVTNAAETLIMETKHFVVDIHEIKGKQPVSISSKSSGVEKGKEKGMEEEINLKDKVLEKTSSVSAGLSTTETLKEADLQQREIQATLLHEKHIPGAVTPPTVPVSPNILDETVEFISGSQASTKDIDLSGVSDIITQTENDIPSKRLAEVPLGVVSQVPHPKDASHDFDDARTADPMSVSLYGSLPGDSSNEQYVEPTHLFEITKAKYLAISMEKTGETTSCGVEKEKVRQDSNSGQIVSAIDLQTATDDADHFGREQMDMMTASFYGNLPSADQDPISSWGKPLGLPSPAPPNDNKGTPKKERKLPLNVSAKNKLNDERKRAESPSKNYKNRKITPVYVDLTYVPHHGNTYYSYIDFFRRVRARYYVFSGIEPSREVYNALLEAKQSWEDKDLEVTIIPTYDTDILGYWVAENEELLTKYKIDLSPSASRCTINLQDHETSCSAYRLEF